MNTEGLVLHRRPGSDGLEEDLLLILGREDDDADRGQLASDALRGLDAGEPWQIHLDDQDVRLQLVCLRDGLFAVGSHTDDLHVRLFLDHLPDAHGGEATRIGEKDPDRAFGPIVHSCSL